MLATQTRASVRDFPGRVEAERELATALRRGAPRFVAIVIARRGLALAEQLGYDHADTAVLECGLEMAERLPVWRWSGLAMMTLCERPEELQHLSERAEVRALYLPVFEDMSTLTRALDTEAAMAIAGD